MVPRCLTHSRHVRNYLETNKWIQSPPTPERNASAQPVLNHVGYFDTPQAHSPPPHPYKSLSVILNNPKILNSNSPVDCIPL